MAFEPWLLAKLERLPFGPKLVAAQTRLSSFADQGLQGAANLLASVVLARALDHQAFAVIGMMLGVHYFVFGLHRSNVVLPFILDVRADPAHERQAETAWWAFNLVVIVVLGLGLVGTAALVHALAQPSYRWIAHALLLSAMVTPALCLAEFARRVLFQRRLALTAAFTSAIYLALNVGGALAAAHWAPTASMGSLCWVAAGVVSGLAAAAAALPGRLSLKDGLAIWWRDREFAGWQTLTHLPFAIYNASAVILIGLFGGAVAAAAFTAARTLTNPAVSVVSAIDSLDKPRAARALASGGVQGMKRSIGRTRRLIIVLTGGYLALLAVFVTPVMHLAFGDRYAGQTFEIRLLALAFFLICLNQPSETALIVLRAGKALFTTRVLCAVVAVVSLALARPFGLLGSCLALILTQVVNVTALAVAEGRASHGRAKLDDLHANGEA